MPAFEWRWNVLNPYYGNFLEGLVITGQLSAIIIAGALFFGVILGAARYSKRRIVLGAHHRDAARRRAVIGRMRHACV